MSNTENSKPTISSEKKEATQKLEETNTPNTENSKPTPNDKKDEEKQKREDEIKKIEKNIKWYTGGAWGFVVFGLVFALLPLVTSKIMGMELNDYGDYGDYTGGVVASLWSLAGLFMVYIAFLGQRIDLLNQQTDLLNQQTEISLTREEMQAQRAAMQEQAQEAKAQAKALKRQTFLMKEQQEAMREQAEALKQQTTLMQGQQEAMQEQAKEAKAQAEALKQQTFLMKGQQEAMQEQVKEAKAQVKVLKLQTILMRELQFAQLLKEWNLLSSKLQILNDPKKLIGRDCFNEYIRLAEGSENTESTSFQSNNPNDTPVNAPNIEKWHNFEDREFGMHKKYFEMTFFIIETIAGYSINESDKLNYFRRMKSHMSPHEARVFFYHSLRKEYTERRRILNKYHFFLGFGLKSILDTDYVNWRSFYDESAFEETPNNEGDQPSA